VPEPDAPHPVDLHVGGKIRLRRKLIGMSQGALGDRLGLTFQQMQKYERGANRVSASKLQAIAVALGVKVSWFFEGLGDPTAERCGEDPIARTMDRFLATAEGFELARAFPGVPAGQRRSIVALARSLAEEDGNTPALQS